MPEWTLENMDVIEWASKYKGGPFHCLVCDTPYHLTSTHRRFSSPNSKPAKYGKDGAFQRASRGFCGQEWDGGDIAFRPETWAALGQHLHPGGFMMAFASSRGWHRMAVAIEDAGFIIHPSIFMLGYSYGSGFPKATRIDTQIDRAVGIEQQVAGITKRAGKDRSVYGKYRGNHEETIPATPLAKTWAGHRYGLQALKPALEPVIVAQKPYDGRPVDCITETGAGALNIDAGRIGTDVTGWGVRPSRGYSGGLDSFEEDGRPVNGRWPSNLILHHDSSCQPGNCADTCPVERLGEQSGERVNGYRFNPSTNRTTWFGSTDGSHTEGERGYDDSGTAARFYFQADWQHEILEQLHSADPVFYTAKASRTEREAGLGESEKNNHPTVKSLSLTSYLAKLLLPPDAYKPRRILVPFAGVGSEMAGAILAGWEEIVGIEQSAHYADIARARIDWWSRWPGWGQTEVDAILSADNDRQDGQLSFFDAT